MASITDEEKRFAKGMMEHYPEKTSQEILGIINGKRGNSSNHINSGRISEVKHNDTIQPMSKEKVDKWLK